MRNANDVEIMARHYERLSDAELRGEEWRLSRLATPDPVTGVIPSDVIAALDLIAAEQNRRWVKRVEKY